MGAQVPMSSIQRAQFLIDGSTASAEELGELVAEVFRHGSSSSGKENEDHHHARPVLKGNAVPTSEVHAWLCQVSS